MRQMAPDGRIRIDKRTATEDVQLTHHEKSAPEEGGGVVANGSDTVLDNLDKRAFFESVPDGIAIVDMDGRIRAVNARFEALFGYPRTALVGQPIESLLPESAREAHKGHRTAYASNPYARPMAAGLDLEGQHRDGGTFPVEVSLSPMRTPEGDYVVCSVRDIIARKRLRRFTAGTLQAAEDERLRVAQELHDDTAQQLSALLLRLKIARSTEEREDLDEKLAELRDAIQECAEGVRRIARGLRPPALQDVGVVAAIRSHVSTVEETRGLTIGVTADTVEGALGPDADLVLYRVVQEAVSNVVRHAEASSVTITIQRSGLVVRGVVEDDGIGFDVLGPGRVARGLGLVGMEERVASVGGIVEVVSSTGRGTRVTVEIPIEKEAAPNA